MHLSTIPRSWSRPAFADLALVAVFALLLRANLSHARQGGWGMWLLILQQLWVVGVALIRRRAVAAVAWDSPEALLAWCGTLAPLLVRPAALAAFPWASVGATLQLLGQALMLAATVALGRSFGIVAARRGVRTGGLYRVVRHPLYAAELPAFGGWVCGHPSWWNGALLLAWTGVQLARIRAEERMLLADWHYLAYTARVRYRLVPWIW